MTEKVKAMYELIRSCEYRKRRVDNGEYITMSNVSGECTVYANGGGIHTVRVHIRVDLLAVLLLLGFDVGKHLTVGGVGEFKNGGVVDRGNVLFGREHIAAEEGIALAVAVIFVMGGATAIVVGLERGRRFGNGAAHHALDGFKVRLLCLFHVLKCYARLKKEEFV